MELCFVLKRTVKNNARALSTRLRSQLTIVHTFCTPSTCDVRCVYRPIAGCTATLFDARATSLYACVWLCVYVRKHAVCVCIACVHTRSPFAGWLYICCCVLRLPLPSVLYTQYPTTRQLSDTFWTQMIGLTCLLCMRLCACGKANAAARRMKTHGTARLRPILPNTILYVYGANICVCEWVWGPSVFRVYARDRLDVCGCVCRSFIRLLYRPRSGWWLLFVAHALQCWAAVSTLCRGWKIALDGWLEYCMLTLYMQLMYGFDDGEWSSERERFVFWFQLMFVVLNRISDEKLKCSRYSTVEYFCVSENVCWRYLLSIWRYIKRNIFSDLSVPIDS